MYNVIYESCPWHTRVSLMDQKGRLLSVRYDDASFAYSEGALCLGRVRKIMTGLNAAFVDIGDVEDGFLPLDKLPADRAGLTEGAAVVVRISRGRTQDKGARLTGKVLRSLEDFSDAKIPSIVEAAPSALSRALMDAGSHEVKVWIPDARLRTQVLPIISEQHLYQLDQHEDVDLFDSLDNQLELLAGETFPLAGGGALHIEYTKALTSIDVDSGGANITDKAKLAYNVNKNAAEEIARLCSVLNLGGSIIVDFISMRSRTHRREITDYLGSLSFENDIRKVDVLSMSRFGLLEMNREKVGETLVSYIKSAPIVAGDILLKMWRNKPGRYSYWLEASPEVLAILTKHLTHATCLAYFGKPVDLKAKENFSIGQYILSSSEG